MLIFILTVVVACILMAFIPLPSRTWLKVLTIFGICFVVNTSLHLLIEGNF